MAFITGTRRDGSSWTPKFVKALDSEVCIACGRCFKACAHACLALQEVEDEESERMFMSISNEGACIGCEACSKACPKGCFTHEAVEA